MYITQEQLITQNIVKQYFAADDDNLCLLKHIYEWIENKMDTAQSKSTYIKYKAKQAKFLDITQKSGKKKIGYFTRFKDGIPEDELYNLANDLQIHIKIQKPFNENIYLNIKSTKKPLRTF